MKVKINDTFPGESKGKTKELDDITARELIANKWATEVKDKPKTAAELKAEQEAADAKAKAEADEKAAKEAQEAEAAKAKADAEAAERQTKEDKQAGKIQTK